MQASKAVFVGDKALLTRCVEVFLRCGGVVTAIVTRDAKVAGWARERGLPLVDKARVDDLWRGFDCDFLFSVANLDMLPEAALACPRELALNFHDGPLPAYAGLNAPAWALVNGETAHGVTWHEMTAKADAGRIAAAARVEIEPGETALSLNTKCFEAGLACFESIVERLAAGTLVLEPQLGERSYFGRLRQPPAAGTIDPFGPAETLTRLVAGLSAGPYESPLGFAKLKLGDAVLLVGAAEIRDGAAEAGQVMAVDAESVTIGAATALVRLSDLRTVDGAPVDPRAIAALRPGARLAPLPEALAARLEKLNRRAAGAGEAWRAELSRMRAFTPPLPGAGAGRVFGEAFRTEIQGPADLDRRVAALAAWAGRLAESAEVSFAYRSADHDAELGEAAAWFSPWRPLTLALDPALSLDAAAAAVGAARARIEALGPLACDLRLRAAPEERAALAPSDLGLAIAVGADAAAPRGAEILAVLDPQSATVDLRIAAAAYDAATAQAIAAQIAAALAAFAGDGAGCLGEAQFAPEAERELFARLSAGPVVAADARSLADAVAAQAGLTPDAPALVTRWERLTYAELQARVDLAAARLARLGAGKGAVVGVCMERGPDLVAALLAVLRTGAAYLPLDPAYPAERIALMLAEAGATLVVASPRTLRTQAFGAARPAPFDELAAGEPDGAWTAPRVAAEDLAYLIYTSGSTGRPKGVMIPHRAAMNFLRGMDARVPHQAPGTWLAVTSPNFDISVLEMFWTLSRGFTVALHGAVPPGAEARAPSFSLFYFAAAAPDEAEPYRLLFEGAKFADANGFEAVWTPERHFHAFGSPYPNPAVTAAAVAAQTSRIHVRAGSCVLPLHSPIRVAEEWAVVDVISQGRAGLAFASGWQPTDFVLAPEAFADRKALMLSGVEAVRALWRGEAVGFAHPDGSTAQVRAQPRPVQAEAPVWLTAAKSSETFETAGARGYNVLTHLLGMSLEEVGENIRRYRAAWAAAGHPGQGRVTLMLHAFVGEDDESVREIVREPMKRYLGAAFDLVRDAAWTFPAFVQRGLQDGKSAAEIFEDEPISAEETDALLEHAFDRYFRSSGLFGGQATCLEMVKRVAGLGVDEIACLVDFGVPTDQVLDSLPALKAVMDAADGAVDAAPPTTVAEDLVHFAATHLQCTPSMAAMVAADPMAAPALAGLEAMLVGGEALPRALARELRGLMSPRGRLLNMYGPTEATVWSTVAELGGADEFIPLGEPIANTVLAVVDGAGRPRPALAAGELWIGGDGVAHGYWNRPDLTAERFVETPQGRMYRTGDLVRRHLDGRLEFLGRLDHQVKLRGHRIELGEIEAALLAQAGVAQAVVVARDEADGERRLVGYYVERPGESAEPAALRAGLAARLPEIMVPPVLVRLAALPLTPNGKIDRAALPAPQTRSAPAEASPAEGLEALVAEIWCEVLGLDAVSATRNFFDLGGHSLTAVQVQRRLRARLGRELPITDIFRFPTVRGLAGRLGASAAGPRSVAVGLGAARAQARLAARRASVAIEAAE